jgi:hypothetical protein
VRLLLAICPDVEVWANHVFPGACVVPNTQIVEAFLKRATLRRAFDVEPFQTSWVVRIRAAAGKVKPVVAFPPKSSRFGSRLGNRSDEHLPSEGSRQFGQGDRSIGEFRGDDGGGRQLRR